MADTHISNFDPQHEHYIEMVYFSAKGRSSVPPAWFPGIKEPTSLYTWCSYIERGEKKVHKRPRKHRSNFRPQKTKAYSLNSLSWKEVGIALPLKWIVSCLNQQSGEFLFWPPSEIKKCHFFKRLGSSHFKHHLQRSFVKLVNGARNPSCTAKWKV